MVLALYNIKLIVLVLKLKLLVQPMVNQVQSVYNVLPNKDVVAVDFLNWCEDKVRHIVTRLLEMLSNRQAGGKPGQ